MKLFVFALVASLVAATPVPEAEAEAVRAGDTRAGPLCYSILHGWCPGDDSIKYVPGLSGCFYTYKTCGGNDVRGVYAYRPFSYGCHVTVRNSGKCDGLPYNVVWVPRLGKCKATQTGLCPGGATILWVNQ